MIHESKYPGPKSTVYLGDCMDFLKEYKENEFDLAPVDVPYGIGASNYKRGGTQYGNSKAKCNVYTHKDWDKESPSAEYFDLVSKVSENQIIWGANHFISKIPFDSSCWIVWDKQNGEGSGYADCELAWTSFNSAVKLCKIRWAGMLQHDMKNKESRIHPTQKPIKLYDWIFKNYAKPGMKILDTHLGSQSSRIAAHKAGLEFVGIEKDEDYFRDGNKRFENYAKQLTLF